MNTNTQFIRNIGIAAHIDAGKTTTTERILYYAGAIHQMGEVHEGSTVTDHDPLEQQRGITITAAAISCAWTRSPFPSAALAERPPASSPAVPPEPGTAGEAVSRANATYGINLIDTPGHIDFTAEVERSLRVLDGAVVLFSAVDGVQPQSETVWRQANKYRVPRIVFVNKMDRPGADFTRTVEQIRRRLNANAHALYVPVGNEDQFSGLIDVVYQAFAPFDTTASDPRGLRPQWTEIPASLATRAAHARTELVERLAEVDPTLGELYLENRSITARDLQDAIRRTTIARTFFGVIPGSAFKEKGVQRLLDAVVDYLPSPLDVAPHARDEAGQDHALRVEASAPLVALAFKLTSTNNGQLVYTRVYQGTLMPGMTIDNPRTRRRERITRLVRMRADTQENITEAPAGDICAVLGLRDVRTGDTLLSSGSPVGLQLEPPSFPEPVVSLAIEPNTRDDQERMGLALQRLVAEDPTLRVSTNPETGQLLLSGMGELHLDVVRTKLARDFRVETTAGRPQIAFRETITRPARADAEFKRQNGGQGQYAYVVVAIEPNPGGGNVVVDEVVGGAIPKQYFRPTIQGIEDALTEGVLGRNLVTDVRCQIVDGDYHEQDSSDIAFRAAGRIAIHNAMREAAPVLLEPIMSVEVTTPVEHQGDILGDLGRRRAEIRDVTTDGASCTITAEVPLQNLFGYAMDIRSLSKGSAEYSMTPSRYAVVPATQMTALTRA